MENAHSVFLKLFKLNSHKEQLIFKIFLDLENKKYTLLHWANFENYYCKKKFKILLFCIIAKS